jgi:hypothetical protein
VVNPSEGKSGGKRRIKKNDGGDEFKYEIVQ